MLSKVFANRQFMVFVLSCGVAAGVNFGSRMVLGLWMSYAWSIVVAYGFGIVTAYILCRLFVFEAKRNNTWQQMGYFCLVNGFAIILTLVVSLLLYHYVLGFIQRPFVREEVAHFVGICAPLLTSYWGHKYLSFR